MKSTHFPLGGFLITAPPWHDLDAVQRVVHSIAHLRIVPVGQVILPARPNMGRGVRFAN